MKIRKFKEITHLFPSYPISFRLMGVIYNWYIYVYMFKKFSILFYLPNLSMNIKNSIISDY